LLLFLVVSCSLLNSFSIDKHFSANGVHMFVRILDEADVAHFDWSRTFARYLTQWPLIIAVKVGLTDMTTLSRCFATGIYFPYVLSFALCIYALRSESKTLLFFPLMSMVAINLPSDYILAGQHHVMVAMSWPILFFLLRRTGLTWRDGLLLWTSLILFSRLYETAVVPAVIFYFLCVVRLGTFRHKQEAILSGISLLLSLAVVVISVYFIADPLSARNEADFMTNMTRTLTNFGAVASGCFSMVFTAGVVLRKRVVIVSAAVPLLIYVLFRVFVNYHLSTLVSFASRSLSLTLLPVLLLCAIMVWYFKSELNKTNILIFTTFIVLMTAVNIYDSNDWRDFRAQVKQIVETQRGYVSIKDTVLRTNRNRWGWNNTEFGLVWSAPCVRAVLLNPSHIRWEPFDPRKELVLKKYLQYDAFFKTVDESISTCGTTVSSR
jgi:hypothetical protein